MTLRIAIVAGIVIALIVAACGGSGDGVASSEVRLSADVDTYVFSEGVSVKFNAEVPDGSLTVAEVEEDESLESPAISDRVAPILSIEAPPFSGLILLDLSFEPDSLPDAELRGQVYAAYWADGSWIPVDTEVVSEGVVRVRTDHLSLWSVFAESVSGVVRSAVGIVGGVLNVLPGPLDHECATATPDGWSISNSQPALAGVCVVSDSENEATLTLTNRRRYYVEGYMVNRFGLDVESPTGSCSDGHKVFAPGDSVDWRVSIQEGHTIPSMELNLVPSVCAALVQIVFDLLGALPGGKALKGFQAAGLSAEGAQMIQELSQLSGWSAAILELRNGNLPGAAVNMAGALTSGSGAEIVARQLSKVGARISKEAIGSFFLALRVREQFGRILDPIYATIQSGGDRYAAVTLTGPPYFDEPSQPTSTPRSPATDTPRPPTDTPRSPATDTPRPPADTPRSPATDTPRPPTDTPRPPTDAPTQLSPADGTVFNHFPRTTTLTWSTVPGAASYTLERQIKANGCAGGWGWCTDFYRLVTDLSETTFTFGFVGAQPGRWRVWAVDAGGQEGPKSGWWTFRYTR